MLVIAVHFMGGVYHAASDDQESPEWPPHPVRLFFSMVDAYHRTHSTDLERDALLWLEALPPPQIAAKAVPGNDYRQENPIVYYVPTSLQKDGGINKQPRHFPYTVLKDPVMYFLWPDAEPSPTIIDGLTKVLRKVYRMGNSRSSVFAYIPDASAAIPTPNFIPSTTSTTNLHDLRWSFGTGQLVSLEETFAHRSSNPVYRWNPRSKEFKYTERDRQYFRSTFAESWTIYKIVSEKRILHARSVGPIVDNIRHRMMVAWGTRFPHTIMPRILSGHNESDSAPSQEGGHLAILGLPHVGYRGDGHLTSIAFCMPRHSNPQERMKLQEVLGSMHGGSPTIDFDGFKLEFLSDSSQISKRWCRYSKEWTTAIPLALDRHPGDLRMGQDAETMQRRLTKIGETISRSCSHIGLPNPEKIEVHPSEGFLHGCPSIQELRGSQHGSVKRRYIHARIIFRDGIYGPVILGSHRFRGFGLCLPTFRHTSP